MRRLKPVAEASTPGADRLRPWTVGARWDGRATTVSVRSPGAERVELCRIRPGGVEWRTDLTRTDDGRCWELVTPELEPGDRYGFRAHGADMDPAHLLVDPAARAVSGRLDWSSADFTTPGTDTGAHVPWGVVVDPSFDWGADSPPAVAPGDRIIYEANVRSLTALHPDIAPERRGTYLGLAEPPVIEHLIGLGITTVELQPVQQFVAARALWEQGLNNLWGYDPVAWFAPHGAYATCDDGSQVAEFQTMVRTLHAAGIELVLDVVFNHSGEYDRRGPTLNLRGLDDRGWYRHHEDGRYEDTTGCGNTIDLRPQSNRSFVVECLRYWIETFHIDGFRFDLATTLLRGDHGVDDASPFLADIAADPVVSRSLLIAEPWDAAADGYALGFFPSGWAEWNDRYRDDVRDVWRGADLGRRRLTTRLAGSSDLFGPDRRPSASINFVTAHDGFTLADLVAYEHRHNEANGEGGNDGASDNRSWNCGVEGGTDDPAVLALRSRQQRNLLATLLVSRGTPMVVSGDEMGRTQQGNNNAYCQDNSVSWLDWAGADQSLVAFTSRAVGLRRSHGQLGRNEWLDADDVSWRDADGSVLAGEIWDSDPVLVMAMSGVVVVVNPTVDDRPVTLPDGTWSVALDTTSAHGDWSGQCPEGSKGASDVIMSRGRSVLVLTAPGP